MSVWCGFRSYVPYVQCLSQRNATGDLKAALDLLQIITSSTSTADLDTYYTVAANKSFITSSSKLNWDTLRHSQQLLSICTLAASAKASTLTYGEVAIAVGVPVDEVEFWVVDAIANGLVDATLNQVTSTITIT